MTPTPTISPVPTNTPTPTPTGTPVPTETPTPTPTDSPTPTPTETLDTLYEEGEEVVDMTDAIIGSKIFQRNVRNSRRRSF